MRARVSQEVPTSSGVYQIRCLPTGKIYIGSAVNLHARWHLHRRALTLGQHHNPYLQSAWNVFGEEAFEFSILERTDARSLLSVEQSWIERTGCTDRRFGFNVKWQATCGGNGIGQSWPGFRSPEGHAVTIVNLSDFCRRNRLDFPSMLRLSQGRSKLKSYKGWTHINSVRQRDFIKTHDGFINPDGRAVGPIRNLAGFCRKHGLDNTHMIAVASGRIVSHRGWTHLRGRKRQAPVLHRGFVAPGGACTRITNLAAFCRACGLSKAHMYQLKSGKRPSHKGWTWKYDADAAFE